MNTQTNDLRREWLFLAYLIGFATILFYSYSMAWPLVDGRDYTDYLGHYYGIVSSKTFFRPVGASYLLGWLSQLSLPWQQFAILLLYLTHLLTAYYTARLFGVVTARIVAIILLLDISVLAAFLRLDSDPLFCLAASIWSAVMVTFFRNRNLIVSFFLGVLLFLPILIRQSAIVLLLSLLFPLICFGFSKQNWRQTGVIALGAVMGLCALTTYNYLHFNRVALAAPAGLYLPAFHVFKYAPKFAPEYGPHNQKLLKTIEAELLTQEVYLNNHVDLNQFLTDSLDTRKFSDLIYLNNIHPNIVEQATFESIQARPLQFLKSLASMTWNLYLHDNTGFLPLPTPETATTKPHEITIAYSSRPDLLKQIQDPFPPQTIDLQAITDKITQATKNLGEQGNYHLAFVIKYLLANVIPPLLFFLVLSIFLLCKITLLEIRLLLTLLIPAVCVVFGSGLISQLPAYRVPFDFLIILGGVVGIQRSRWLTLPSIPTQAINKHSVKEESP